MTPSEFQDQQRNVLQNQRRQNRDRVIKLTSEEYTALESMLQWPEDRKAYDRLNTPTLLTEIQI